MNSAIVIRTEIMCRSDTLCYLGEMINPTTKLKANHTSFIAVCSFSIINVIISRLPVIPKEFYIYFL